MPDWYIASCKKIKYMFPKAHAAAYVMMAWRIGYCKIHYPLAYYGAFFSIRAKAFSYELMCQGRAHLEGVMADYNPKPSMLLMEGISLSPTIWKERDCALKTSMGVNSYPLAYIS